MRFKSAIKEISILKSAYRTGLKALSVADRKRIFCKNTHILRGSIYFDKVLAIDYPNDPRWDYGIGIDTKKGSDRVIWVEVHPASSSHVQGVIEKSKWLKEFLEQYEWPFTEQQQEFVWIASGKVSILLGSPQRRKLALAGIRFAGSNLLL
jgi:hypothetical protein